MMADDAPFEPLRRAGRRATDPALAPAETARQSSPGANLPVPVGVAGAADAPSPAGPIEAQILGQEGHKRGLRGGAPVLNQARSAYLGAEFSGAANRRPKPGVVARTEI
jgi:hypothetical protein